MESKLRYFLIAFFGSLVIFILMMYGYSLINSGDRSLIAIAGRVLIYYTVPIFILALVNVYLPGYFAKRSNLIFRNLYVQIVQSIILLVIMVAALAYLEGLNSDY
jgi:hypothetical protein